MTGARTLGHMGTWPGCRMAARGLSPSPSDRLVRHREQDRVGHSRVGWLSLWLRVQNVVPKEMSGVAKGVSEIDLNLASGINYLDF